MQSVSLFIISSILCGTNAFDMKYSLLKDVWTKHKTIEESTQNDTTDIYPDYSMKFWGPTYTQLLKSTVLAGGALLTDSYLIFADFQINVTIPSCLFSMERKEKPKLALCLQPAGDDAVTLTLDAANIPDGKISFGHKIKNNKRTKLIVSVKSTGVTLLTDCEVIEEKRFSSNISKQIHLTDEMELVLGKFTPPEPKLMMKLNNLDLYSPVDATTLMTLCPDILPPEIKGERGEKGDQGQHGPSGMQGPVGYPGRTGLKGDKGDEGNMGPRGRDGMYGPPGMKGATGVGEKGERGERGPPGPSCPATAVAPTATAEMDVLKSMLSDIKSIFNNYILEKTEQLKYFTELNTKCNERLTTAELNIEALKNAMLTEAQS